MRLQFRFMFLVLFVLGLGLIADCKCQKEIDNWNFGKHADTACPPFGVYPLFYSTQKLTAKYLPEWKDPAYKAKNHVPPVWDEKKVAADYIKAWQKSAARWNKASKGVGGPDLLVPLADLNKYEKPKGWKGVWPILIEVEDAPIAEYLHGKECQLLVKGIDPWVQGGGLLYTQFGFKEMNIYGFKQKIYTTAKVIVCSGKFESGKTFRGPDDAFKVGDQLRQGGMYRYMLHESGHTIFGNGNEHPAQLGEVMRRVPRNEAIHTNMLELMKQRVIKACREAGRFAKKTG